MRDCTGKEIKQGDTVVIARRSGSRCWLVTDTVIEVISPDNKHIVTFVDNGEVVTTISPGISSVDEAALTKIKLRGKTRPYVYSASQKAIMVVSSVCQ